MTTTSPLLAEFGGLTVEHDAQVLEPRSWTLLQSDWAVELDATLPPGPMLELCCGVGHIGLEAVRRTRRHLVQVDVCDSATAFARRNAAAAGLTDHVTVRCAALLGLCASTERFPIVLADPPYLPSSAVGSFPADPERAVDGGPDGLAVIAECVAVIDQVLDVGGVALLQVRGAAQAAEVARQLPAGLRAGEVRSHDDERAVLALIRAEGASR